MWVEVIKFVGGSAVLLAIAGWLIRTIIQHFLTKDIEQYKFDIRRQGEIELEKLKAALNIEAVTHEITFSKLHNRRAEIIEELFKKLMAFDDSASTLMVEFDMDDSEGLREMADKFIDIYYDFHKYAEQNQIYFSEELCKLIAELHSEAFDQSIRVTYHTTPYSLDDLKKAFSEEKFRIQSHTELMKRKVQEEFRELLGTKG